MPLRGLRGWSRGGQGDVDSTAGAVDRSCEAEALRRHPLISGCRIGIAALTLYTVGLTIVAA